MESNSCIPSEFLAIYTYFLYTTSIVMRIRKWNFSEERFIFFSLNRIHNLSSFLFSVDFFDSNVNVWAHTTRFLWNQCLMGVRRLYVVIKICRSVNAKTFYCKISVNHGTEQLTSLSNSEQFHRNIHQTYKQQYLKKKKKNQMPGLMKFACVWLVINNSFRLINI